MTTGAVAALDRDIAEEQEFDAARAGISTTRPQTITTERRVMAERKPDRMWGDRTMKGAFHKDHDLGMAEGALSACIPILGVVMAARRFGRGDTGPGIALILLSIVGLALWGVLVGGA